MIETIKCSTVSKVALAALCATCACAVGLALSAPAEAAAPKATTQVKVLKAKKFKKAKQGKTAGTAKDSAALAEDGPKAIGAIKIAKSGKVKGNVVYTLYAKGKTFKNKKNGAVAGNGKKAGRAISIKLSGTMKKKYDIHYRAYVKGYGWTNWTKNGKKAGSDAYDMTAVTVKIVKKGSKLASAYGKAYLAKKSIATEWAGMIGYANDDDLNKALAWVSENVAYQPTGRTTLESTTDFSATRVETELKAAFEKREGDCYTYTALGCAVANEMGKDARVVAGTYTSASGKVQPYSWMAIGTGTDTVIYDVTNNRLGLTPADEVYKQFAEVA